MEASLPSEKASVPASIIVRMATVEDVELLHRFSVDLATYEDEPDAVASTPQTLARDGFGKDPQFAALIAQRGATPVGFAMYTFNYSVWNPARGFYERLGFKWIRNWLPYRLSGEALEKLARD